MQRLLVLGFALCVLVSRAAAAETVLHLNGEVPTAPETHFFLPFEVPAGIVEIEVRHDDLSNANILDWGLDDPDGFRGWGGGNSEPAIVGVSAASRSYVPGLIKAGTWEVVVGKAKVVELPAHYAVDVILRNTPSLAAQTERTPYVERPPVSSTARWYAGDFHVHSRESGDARPSIEEVLQFAHGRGLDFIMLSEHNTNSQLSWYHDAQARVPEVLLLPGVEFTTYGGHANGIGARQWVDHKIGVRGATLDAAIRKYHEQGALFSINHPQLRIGDLCIGCGWDHEVDPKQIDAVEIRTGLIPGMRFWETLVAAGSHAAAVGGSDDHSAGIVNGTFDSPIGSPTTLVYAKNLSVPAIMEGLRSARTVVKLEGPDAPMIDTEVSGQRRGKVVYATHSSVRATVTGGNGGTLRLIKDGDTLEQTPITSDPFVHSVDVDAPLTGEDRYRYEVLRESKLVTVASYVWLQQSEPAAPATGSDSEGCAITLAGVTESSSILPLLVPALAVWIARRRRNHH